MLAVLVARRLVETRPSSYFPFSSRSTSSLRLVVEKCTDFLQRLLELCAWILELASPLQRLEPRFASRRSFAARKERERQRRLSGCQCFPLIRQRLLMMLGQTLVESGGVLVSPSFVERRCRETERLFEVPVAHCCSRVPKRPGSQALQASSTVGLVVCGQIERRFHFRLPVLVGHVVTDYRGSPPKLRTRASTNLSPTGSVAGVYHLTTR